MVYEVLSRVLFGSIGMGLLYVGVAEYMLYKPGKGVDLCCFECWGSNSRFQQ
jgi:hypothetical protein